MVISLDHRDKERILVFSLEPSHPDVKPCVSNDILSLIVSLNRTYNHFYTSKLNIIFRWRVKCNWVSIPKQEKVKQHHHTNREKEDRIICVLDHTLTQTIIRGWRNSSKTLLEEDANIARRKINEKEIDTFCVLLVYYQSCGGSGVDGSSGGECGGVGEKSSLCVFSIHESTVFLKKLNKKTIYIIIINFN